MNIFVLDTDPKIAASYHCDQHLHKMILESAQMLCATLKHFRPDALIPYKTTHANHPCTIWLRLKQNHVAYVISLAYELNHIRESLGRPDHSSIEVIRFCEAFLLPQKFPSDYPILSPQEHIFCGPYILSVRNDIDVVEKYKQYYQKKHLSWLLDKGKGMTYKGRPVPYFMQELLSK